LTWRDRDAVVRGLFRLIPTSMPYMLERCWPYMCQTRPLPKSHDVWELGRVCVDRFHDTSIRKLIVPALLTALQEFCESNGIEAVVGLTRRHLVDHYVPAGVEWLGEASEIEGEQEAAFRIPARHLRPVAHCARYGLPKRLLSLEPLTRRIAA
jgi:N-acyl-L-homoserine lactone synthetase